LLSRLTLLRKIELWVPLPGRGKGAGRASVSKGGKPFIFQDSTTRQYEMEIRILATARARELDLGMGTFTGPVVLSAYFLYKPPLNVTRNGKSIKYYPGLAKLTKPDPTNLLKAAEDACTGIFWQDDKQIIGYDQVWKDFSPSGREGFLLIIQQYKEPEPPPRLSKKKT
jgi:Holliday junction resolvase RusA-like endonuclease